VQCERGLSSASRLPVRERLPRSALVTIVLRFLA
jgi:hypothetical protein